MPKPLPEYVPPLVAERLKKKGYNGLKGLAVKLGKQPTVVQGVFGANDCKSIDLFIEIANALDMTVPELRDHMKAMKPPPAVSE